MRFATRTFLWSFVPFAVLLMATFAVIQTKVVSTVRNGLRSSLREKQVSIARLYSKSELQNGRFLKIVGESAALKAGLQLVLADPKSGDARLTVEDQLREICQTLGFDFLLVSNLEGAALAGVMRLGEQLVAIDVARTPPPQRGFFTVGGQMYQVTSIPVDQGDEHIATLSVGEHFDFAEFSTPAVLTRDGKVLMANIPGVSLTEAETALKACSAQAECEVRLGGEAYLCPADGQHSLRGRLFVAKSAECRFGQRSGAIHSSKCFRNRGYRSVAGSFDPKHFVVPVDRRADLQGCNSFAREPEDRRAS